MRAGAEIDLDYEAMCSKNNEKITWTNFHFVMCIGIVGFFVFWIVLLCRMYLPPGRGKLTVLLSLEMRLKRKNAREYHFVTFVIEKSVPGFKGHFLKKTRTYGSSALQHSLRRRGAISILYIDS